MEEFMAPTKRDDRSVTRTYRAAVRLGEDFITLEETITLPIDASDADVEQAVDLGWRMYRAQRESLDQQIAHIREAQPVSTAITVRDPESPASEKQRNYIAALQDDLSWTNEQLVTYATEHNVDLVTLTKGQASGFIDDLKRLAEDRGRYSAETPQPARARAAGEASPPASERQLQALARLAQSRAVDLDAEAEQRFGVALSALTQEQASSLISEWQGARRG
jgi:hypothetical protein